MSCKRPKFPIDQDPDYEDIIAHQNKRIKLLEKDANEKSIKKIQRIVKNQFAHSIADKEEEIDVADQRLSEARMMLDRLRAYIVAGYYSAPEKFTNDSVCNPQTSVHPTIKTILCGKKPSCEKFKSEKIETQTKASVFEELKSVNLTKISNSVKQELKTETEISTRATPAESCSISPDAGRGSRFKVSRKIIVGNTSQYIPDAKREPKDPLIYKWLVYVRAPEGEATIDSFVKKVSFVLHPSFGTNSVVEVSKPPFRIIRRGWGEFPIRVQIDFLDSRNKSKTIVHPLKFDKAFTGFETRGSETVAVFHLFKAENSNSNKSRGKTILSPEDVVKPDSDITENNEAKDISNFFSEDTKECALLNETSASKQDDEEKTVATERPPGKNVENDNKISTIVSKNEKNAVAATTEKRTALKPQITVFPKKSTILASPNSLSEKIVILSPGIEKKKSGLSLIANRHEKIIVSPSPNLIRANDTAMTKQWTAGVSLLQKTKSKTTANHLQDSSKSANTVIIVPNANNNQEKRVFKVSTDKKQSKSVQNAVNNNNNTNNAAAPVVLLPTDETKVLKTVARPIVKETVCGTNGVPYVKCVNQIGETFLVPESFLKIPPQSLVLPQTATVEAKSSSLPMYHIQVRPPTSSTTQAQVVALNSFRNLVSSTILTTNAITSSTHAQNTKLASFFNTNSSTQTRYSSSKAVPVADVQSTRKHVEIESLDDMDDVMRYFVKFFPITAKNGVSVDKIVHPYCASSVDVFFSWNLGRQRAAEWQRAKAVQKLVKTVFNESAKWKDKEVWPAKKIFWWCRRWGFSPMKTENEVLSDEIAPKVVLEYSEASELCTQLDESQKTRGQDKGENDEAEIDVVSADDSVSFSNISTSPLKQKIFERIQLPSTPELEFIQDAVTQIGVKLKPVEVFPGVLANIVDEMLLNACKCFIDNITRRSLVQAFQRTGDKKCPSTLTLEDVCHCIETVPEFDFLTHKFLGKNNR